ncbi:NAD(P)H-binding protein [Micromonospora sp. CPCC 205371]|nr:NAD(P)H-binding protein [Micromonospora sp. CPCC 205371]
MRVTVLGGTGKIGRHVVDQLLAAEHQVVALVRNPGKLTIKHPNLTVQVGQLSNPDAVREALTGSDAVISALGPSLKRGAKGTPVTDGTRTVVAAMRQAGVRRFIGLATPSVPDPRDRPSLKGKVLPVLAKAMFPNALAELRGMTAAVTDSDLDWTIARITNPTGKPAAGTLRAGFLGVDTVGSAMSRADIAAFLVAQLGDRTYLRAAPAISN